jgi:hypothetical protein
MECRDLIVDGLSRVEGNLRQTVEGLTAEQLASRPQDTANSIGWLAWHLTRVQDDHISELAGRPQAWVADGWHARFGRPADPGDIGFGDGPDEVASMRPDGPQVLIDYHAAVHGQSLAYLQTLSCADLDRIVDRRWNPPVTAGVRLVSVVDDCAQHVGQMAYVRGLIEGRRWLPY